MPNTTRVSRSRRKPVYHIRNWTAYDQALVQRGSLTFWISDEVRGAWTYAGPRQRGAQFVYSDTAIEAVLVVREVFHLTHRATEGLLGSVFQLLHLELPVPDHSTLSRRGSTVSIRLPKRAHGPLHLVLDSSGLKVYGEGEWKVRKHGWSKHRTWRKFHLAVDADTGEVQASVLSDAGGTDAERVAPLLAQVQPPLASVAADGGYDQRAVYARLQARLPTGRILIPPQHHARIWQHGNTQAPPHPRDETVRFIRQHGRRAWQAESGFHQRSLAETAVFRFKTIFGDQLSARRWETQVTQWAARSRALNLMTHLGMPDSYRVN